MSDEAAELGAPELIWSPFPDAEAAERVAPQLLDEHLIACANVFLGVRSLYPWQGERGEAECGVLLTTNAAKFGAAIARLGRLRPYETPAVHGLRCDAAAPATGAWLEALGR